MAYIPALKISEQVKVLSKYKSSILIKVQCAHKVQNHSLKFTKQLSICQDKIAKIRQKINKLKHQLTVIGPTNDTAFISSSLHM